MCDPVSAAVATAVVSTASAGAGLAMQAKAARQQQDAITAQTNVVNAENRNVASAELFDQMRASRREQAAIRTAAGEAGLSLSSGSIESLLNDSAMQLELASQRSLANLESRNAATAAENASMQSQIERPSLLTSGLQLASVAASGWSSVQGAKIQKAQASRLKSG